MIATLEETGSNPVMLLPDGQKTSVIANPGSRQVIFADTLRQGIYRLQNSSTEVVFASNLADASESDNGPREELNLGGYSQVTRTGQKRADLEIWRWLVLAALIVLMLEWWYYHKRTA